MRYSQSISFYLLTSSIRFARTLEESEISMAFPTVFDPGSLDSERTLSLCLCVNSFFGDSSVHPNMKKRTQKTTLIHRIMRLLSDVAPTPLPPVIHCGSAAALRCPLQPQCAGAARSVRAGTWLWDRLHVVRSHPICISGILVLRPSGYVHYIVQSLPGLARFLAFAINAIPSIMKNIPL
jgi:hypothetical protein